MEEVEKKEDITCQDLRKEGKQGNVKEIKDMA